MLKKFLEYEFALEAFLISLIALCLLILLFKVVIPNFSSKSLAASWMTMLGAFVIFAYSIFVELKEDSFKSSFNTYSCFTDKMAVFSYTIPVYHLGDCGLLRYQDSGSITYLKDKLKIDDAPSVGAELILINAISYIASDFRDWRSEKYSSPGSYRVSYRKKEDSNGDTVLLEGSVFRNSMFRYFDFLPEVAHDFGGYSILPRGSALSLDGGKLVLSNPHFSLEVEPFDLGRVYRIESESPETIWATDFDVRVSYILFKSRSGHWHRSEYKDFCHSLAEGIKARLEVPKEQWPRSRSWA